MEQRHGASPRKESINYKSLGTRFIEKSLVVISNNPPRHGKEDIGNVEIHALAKKPNIVATMNANRLRWMGHLMRVDRNRAAWSIYTSTPQGRRLPGRPRSCWRNEMIRLCQKWRLDDWKEASMEAKSMVGTGLTGP
uniref:Uncharacterized protein n=1 Tax=Cacopsylla melanoneura TaxID=428564 RepID=A0A8D9BAE8_9HEMI